MSDRPTPLDAAQRYVARGWAVLPIPHASKNPGFKQWEQLRLAADDLPSRFNGQPQNIGVLLGEPSAWLVDVDLDHLRAVELADEFLAATPLVFGRAGKPRSHRLYRVTAPVATKKYKSKSSGMIVELRSTGMQTVFPPSTHESGEPICWEDENAEPAEIDPDELLNAVKNLADVVFFELGEKRRAVAKRPSSRSAIVDKALALPEATEISADEQARRCLAAMLRMDMTDHRDGSGRLFAAACRVVEHDLDDPTGLRTIAQYARQRSFPKAWTVAEMLQRVRDAEKTCDRGKALRPDVDHDGLVALGSRDPATGRLVLSLKRTLPTAHAYVSDFHAHWEGRTLHNYAVLPLIWRNNRYEEVEDEAIRKKLHTWLHEALRYWANPWTGEVKLIDFESNPSTVKAALDTIKAITHLPASTTSPSWLRDGATKPPALEILPCRSCLLHLPTMRHFEPTPLFFTTSALDFDPEPSSPPPMEWLGFLHQLFDGDVESLDLLQEWFGYCLICDTSQQKMLLIVGPRRSGKGTIARVLTRLVGPANICGPTTSSLAGAFGLQPLLGKSLAIVSDARFHGENIQTVIERLLCISGEDTLTVDRKHMTSVTMKLSTRFVFLTNELPRLTDASGALAGRFVILRLTESFYGKEDPRLTEKLLVELPRILNWAIEGWYRLRARGHFVMPSSVRDVVQEIEDLSSPVAAFVRKECVVGPGRRVWVDDLYAAWKSWCEREGRTLISTKQAFGRNLAAAVAGISRRRGAGDVPFYEGIDLKVNPS